MRFGKRRNGKTLAFHIKRWEILSTGAQNLSTSVLVLILSPPPDFKDSFKTRFKISVLKVRFSRIDRFSSYTKYKNNTQAFTATLRINHNIPRPNSTIVNFYKNTKIQNGTVRPYKLTIHATRLTSSTRVGGTKRFTPKTLSNFIQKNHQMHRIAVRGKQFYKRNQITK